MARLEQRTAQRQAQARQHQAEQIAAGLAAAQLQEAPDTFAHVQDIAVHIRDQAGRHAHGQRAVVQLGIGGLAPGLDLGQWVQWQAGASAARHLPLGAAPGIADVTGAEDTVTLVHRREQFTHHVG